MCRDENGIERLIENVDDQVERIWEILSHQQSIQNSVGELNKQHKAHEMLSTLKTNLSSISEQDSRDAELVTDGRRDILLGRVELAEQILGWIERGGNILQT